MLSTGVECVSWTDHLSGRQTKLLSCPVVSVRDLKKLKIVKLNGHETEPFLSAGHGLTGTRVVTRCSPCRRRFLIEEAEAVEIIPGAQMAILRRLKQVLRWSPDDIRS